MRFTKYSCGVELSARKNASGKWEIGLGLIITGICVYTWYLKPIQLLLKAGIPPDLIPDALEDVIARRRTGSAGPIIT